jgi:carbonic anhydrase/acetyltransferase-like protein (isoleucine patch superfamily)
MPILIPFRGKAPRIDPSAFVAPNAVLVGDVEVGPEASIWFGAVLRGDEAPVVVGARTNVQDNVVIHVFEGLPTVLEEEVTVGHAAVLEGCRIGRNAVVGMGAVVLQRADLGPGAIVGAGSVVTRPVPAGTLAAGNPAAVKKPVDGESRWWVENAARGYVGFASAMRAAVEAAAAAAEIADPESRDANGRSTAARTPRG